LSTDTMTSGGCSDTDMNALAVIPCTCSPTRVVTIVTPVANRPRMRRSSIEMSASGAAPTSMGASPGSSWSSNVSPMPSGPPVTAGNSNSWGLALGATSFGVSPTDRP
jgi:hypothetical protein